MANACESVVCRAGNYVAAHATLAFKCHLSISRIPIRPLSKVAAGQQQHNVHLHLHLQREVLNTSVRGWERLVDVRDASRRKIAAKLSCHTIHVEFQKADWMQDEMPVSRQDFGPDEKIGLKDVTMVFNISPEVGVLQKVADQF